MEKTVIRPTNGRVVWYWPGHGGSESKPEQPCAAMVAFVHANDPEADAFQLINIGYLDHSGAHVAAQRVPLVQDGDEKPENGHYCEWMPYQKGQAARTDEGAQARLSRGAASSYLIERAAQAAHEANRSYCISLGDLSQLPWPDAPEWQKESAREGVRFLIANPNAGPEAQHNEWCAKKFADGWTLGPEKNTTLKIHPCLVPFDQLPTAQQRKDTLFRETVMPFLTGAGTAA